jgi:hypothetical protein
MGMKFVESGFIDARGVHAANLPSLREILPHDWGLLIHSALRGWLRSAWYEPPVVRNLADFDKAFPVPGRGEKALNLRGGITSCLLAGPLNGLDMHQTKLIGASTVRHCAEPAGLYIDWKNQDEEGKRLQIELAWRLPAEHGGGVARRTLWVTRPPIGPLGAAQELMAAKALVKAHANLVDEFSLPLEETLPVDDRGAFLQERYRLMVPIFLKSLLMAKKVLPKGHPNRHQVGSIAKEVRALVDPTLQEDMVKVLEKLEQSYSPENMERMFQAYRRVQALVCPIPVYTSPNKLTEEAVARRAARLTGGCNEVTTEVALRTLEDAKQLVLEETGEEDHPLIKLADSIQKNISSYVTEKGRATRALLMFHHAAEARADMARLTQA